MSGPESVFGTAKPTTVSSNTPCNVGKESCTPVDLFRSNAIGATT